MLSRPLATFTSPILGKRSADRHARVLIIDETHEGSAELAALLEGWGHAVETAATWDDGLSRATASVPHVVIVNLGSRKADSVKAVRLIRLLPGLHEAPLVVVREGQVYLLPDAGANGNAEVEATASDLRAVAGDELRAAVGAVGE